MTAPHVQRLRRATAHLDSAAAANEAVRDAFADHKARAYADSQRLATVKADNARRQVALALGDMLPDAAEDVAEPILSAADNEAIDIAFKARADRALTAMNAAQAAYNDAARSFLIREVVEPAARLAAALDGVAAAAADLMGAHYAAYERFPKEGRHMARGELYGPAAELIRHLHREFTWTESPYSIRPEWLPKHGPSIEPGQSETVAEAERAAVALVEEVAR